MKRRKSTEPRPDAVPPDHPAHAAADHVFVVTLGLIGTYQVFDQIYVMSSGGPAKTTLTIAYLVYRNGFNNSQMGLGAAIAIVLFIIIFALTMIQRRITGSEADN